MRPLRALPALLSLLVLAAPAVASAQRYPRPPPPSYGPQRDTWYIGLGLGSGNGSYVFDGDRVNFRSHHEGLSSTNLAFQLELGATLTPNLLLGGELSGLTSEADSFGFDSRLTVGQLLAVLTYFPTGRGLFLRGGAGLAFISSEKDEDGFTVASDDANGVGLMGGLGYAWWLGRRFNLTLHGDVNLHAYTGSDVPSSSATFTGYLGFRWY